MTLFEYLIVVSSIILSMGMIRLVSGLPSAFTKGPFWVHFLWLIATLIGHALYWWQLWSAHEFVEWNFARFLYILLGPLLLYSQAVTLVPANPDEVSSWRERFFQVFRAFFIARAFYLVHVAGMGAILRGVPLLSIPAAGQLMFLSALLLSVAGAATTNLRLQGAVVILSVGMMLAGIFSFAFEPLGV